MIRTKKRLTLCITLIVLNLALIWGNSLLSGDESGAMSGSVMQWVMAALHLPAEMTDTVHHLIRKAAHFSEFACLSILLTWLCGMLGERGFHLVCLPIWGGMTAALIDETIQLFSPDRGPSLVDVWIDTSGAAVGMMLLLIGHHWIKRTKRKM